MATIFDRMKSPEGRLSQQGYLFGFVTPFVGLSALSWVSFMGALGDISGLLLQMTALGWTVLLGLGDAMNIRRYHDLGHSGRLYRLCRPGLVGLPLLAFVLQFLIPAQMASTGDLAALSYMIGQDFKPSIAPVPMALLGLTFAGAALNVLYLSLKPGQAGPNDHGPDPRGGVASVPGVTGAADFKARDGEDDPVKRALAAYQREQAKPTQAGAQPARMAAPAAGRQAGAASFGRKRV